MTGLVGGGQPDGRPRRIAALVAHRAVGERTRIRVGHIHGHAVERQGAVRREHGARQRRRRHAHVLAVDDVALEALAGAVLLAAPVRRAVPAVTALATGRRAVGVAGPVRRAVKARGTVVGCAGRRIAGLVALGGRRHLIVADAIDSLAPVAATSREDPTRHHPPAHHESDLVRPTANEQAERLMADIAAHQGDRRLRGHDDRALAGRDSPPLEAGRVARGAGSAVAAVQRGM